jgi:hypothetical protein
MRRGNRIRFSRLPPYESVRLFDRTDRKLWILVDVSIPFLCRVEEHIQVTVRKMVLDKVKASRLGPLGSGDEGIFDVLHVLFCHFLRHGVPVRIRDGARSIDVFGPAVLLLAGGVGVCDVVAGRIGVHPRGVGGSLSAGMCELYTNLGTLGVTEVNHTLQRSDL